MASKLDQYRIKYDSLSRFLTHVRLDLAYIARWPKQDGMKVNNILSPYLKITVMLMGTSRVIDGEDVLALKPGTFILVPPNHCYSVENGKNVDSLEVFLELTPLCFQHAFLNLFPQDRIQCFPEALSMEDLIYLGELYSSMRYGFAGAAAELQEYFHWLLVRILREQSGIGKTITTVTVRQEILEGMYEYLDAHLGEPVTASVLMDHLHVSQSWLYQCCRESTGKGPTELILEHRMHAASILLLDRERMIGEVAQTVGMDAQYFSRQFKRHLGQTPTDYRRMCFGGRAR